MRIRYIITAEKGTSLANIEGVASASEYVAKLRSNEAIIFVNSRQTSYKVLQRIRGSNFILHPTDRSRVGLFTGFTSLVKSAKFSSKSARMDARAFLNRLHGAVQKQISAPASKPASTRPDLRVVD